MPPDPPTRDWWVRAWTLGIEKDATARTFIAFDSSLISEDHPEGKPAAFARWIVPQEDGNLHRLWPDLLDEWDMELMGAFFGGMDVNREKLMGKRPHWSESSLFFLRSKLLNAI